MKTPVVLDFDDTAGPVPGALVLGLSTWQEDIRFACRWKEFRRLQALLEPRLPEGHGTVLLGSGDYHHLSHLLIQRQRSSGPFQVVVFDNHPDNMRFPFGIHCGSWVRHVAMLPQVSHVHVLGITSGDIGLSHAWENHWQPLRAGKLSYWCMDVDVGWARHAGLGHAFHSFGDPDALITAFLKNQTAAVPTYLSIDKDVLSAEVVHTNWDQGRLLEQHLLRVISAFSGRIIGSDITGEISSWQYRSWWKRQLSQLDGQADAGAEQSARWQAQQRTLNARLLRALAEASVPAANTVSPERSVSLVP